MPARTFAQHPFSPASPSPTGRPPHGPRTAAKLTSAAPLVLGQSVFRPITADTIAVRQIVLRSGSPRIPAPVIVRQSPSSGTPRLPPVAAVILVSAAIER
jgi:hypothetical protein